MVKENKRNNRIKNNKIDRERQKIMTTIPALIPFMFKDICEAIIKDNQEKYPELEL